MTTSQEEGIRILHKSSVACYLWHYISAIHPTLGVVGYVEISESIDDVTGKRSFSGVPHGMRVDERFQRRGLATAMDRYALAEIDVKLVPDEDRSPDARAL